MWYEIGRRAWSCCLSCELAPRSSRVGRAWVRSASRRLWMYPLGCLSAPSDLCSHLRASPAVRHYFVSRVCVCHRSERMDDGVWSFLCMFFSPVSHTTVSPVCPVSHSSHSHESVRSVRVRPLRARRARRRRGGHRRGQDAQVAGPGRVADRGGGGTQRCINSFSAARRFSIGRFTIRWLYDGLRKI